MWKNEKTHEHVFRMKEKKSIFRWRHRSSCRMACARWCGSHVCRRFADLSNLSFAFHYCRRRHKWIVFFLFYLWQSLHERQFICTQSDSFTSPPSLAFPHAFVCACVRVWAGPIHVACSRQLWIVYSGQFLSSLATFLILSFPFFGSFCLPPSFSAVVDRSTVAIW